MSVKTIEEYTSTLDEKAKLNLENFIKFMESSYPNIRPKISFSMPMWLKGTRMNEGYIAISQSKNYFSIHFSDEGTVIIFLILQAVNMVNAVSTLAMKIPVHLIP